MDKLDFVDRFLHLSRAATVLSKGQGDELLCMLSLVHHEMEQAVSSLVKEAGAQPILCTYSSDVTPAKVAYHHVDKHHSDPGCGSVHRVGYGLEEFLLQRSFFKSIDASGHCRLAALVSLPKAMDGGKKTQDLFAAFMEHGHLLKERGTAGICVSHHCFDRAAFSSLTKLAYQRHRLWQSSQGGDDGDKKMAELTDWFICCACSNHDAQNALRWALHPHASARVNTMNPYLPPPPPQCRLGSSLGRHGGCLGFGLFAIFSQRQKCMYVDFTDSRYRLEVYMPYVFPPSFHPQIVLCFVLLPPTTGIVIFLCWFPRCVYVHRSLHSLRIAAQWFPATVCDTG